MTSVINTELKNEIQRDWSVPEVSKETMRLYGWANPILFKIKEVTGPKSGDIKDSIQRVLNDIFVKAKTASDTEITSKVWEHETGDDAKAAKEKAVKDWNKTLVEVIAYLRKKL